MAEGPGVIVRLWCLVAVVVWTTALAACAPRPPSGVLLPVARPPSYTAKVDLLVATTRQRGADGEELTAGRATMVNHATVTISIPKNHKPGRIEWPDQVPPDPAFHFLTTDRSSLDRAQFLAEIARRSKLGTHEARSVLVFVHGYNTLHQEAVYQFAQIVHDTGFSGTAVLFSWPSQGKTPLYLADRDASTYSRDYFEQTLQDIASVAGVAEINIMAHSMGNWLAVETLRQAKLKGRGSFNGKLGDVILASPDIDVGVLKTQLEVIGPLRRPMTLLVSGDDKALAVSTFLSGGVERAGQITASDARAVEASKRYNLRVIDLSKVDDGGSTHHNKFAESPAVLRAIGQGLEKGAVDAAAQGGFVTAVTNVGTSLLKLPGALVGANAP